MAINLNLTRPATGAGRINLAGTSSPAKPAAPVTQPAPPASTAPPASIRASLLTAGIAQPAVAFPPSVVFPTLPQIFTLPKTATQLAQGAINLLKAASQAVTQEAINAIKNRNVTADNLMTYLERKVIIGEVLNELAKDWSADTKQDFAQAFQMSADKLDVMDAIVSIAILNDPDLKEELQMENTSEVTEGDLLENRPVVWQYPPAGTILQPPYIVLLAVSHTDTRQTEEIINSILGDLVDHQGFKVPRGAAQKLGGAPLTAGIPTTRATL
ncbi:MAG: hypothetical protein L0229_27225 [Blastocatellia bacterium]|nr:hypothetical protein [Blastocatellia bacterium]